MTLQGRQHINFTLAHPECVEALCILNSAYDDALPVHWPEMIELFATKSLNALSGAIAQSPEQLRWLLAWQPNKFLDAQPSSQRKHFKTVTERLIADNFMQQPSSGPAFVRLASDFFEELARNTARLPGLKTIDIPVKVIWGQFDPYITSDVANDRVSHFKHVSLYLLPGGHWIQSDLPEEVAKQMLS